MIKAEVTIFNNLTHNSLIVTGFKMLEKQGKVKLSIKKDYERGKKLPNDAIIEAKVDGIKISFGTMDGYNFDIKEMEEYLKTVDFFFKRSFSKEENKKFSSEIQKKIFPLSFNYAVSYFSNPMDYQSEKFLKKNYEKLKKINLFLHSYRDDVKYFENHSTENKGTILFMCRLWDPYAKEIENEIVREERRQINKTRIEIIRRLKEEFKDQFIGGVSLDETSKKMCPDIILSDELTIKKNYIKTMKKASICIASTGLHKSTGWKFAEYVVAGKAIISEPLEYEVSGNFKKGINYLEYKNADECIKAVKTLLNNNDLREKMEKANRDYYAAYLRPDKQVENAIKVVKQSLN